MTQEILDTLRKDGYVRLRPLAEIEAMNAFLLSRPVYVEAHVPQTVRNRGVDVQFGRWSEPAMASECLCVATADAVCAPGLLERGVEHLDIASAYLGRDPAVCYSANAMWTRPGPAPLRDDIQSFHVDTDDERFLALFVFLTDVRTPDDGPQDLEGPDGIVRTIYGLAGTCFLADTSRRHRGRKPTRGERGIAWWRYGVSDRPAANEWDRIVPIPASMLGDRYPADPRLREAIKLLVVP